MRLKLIPPGRRGKNQFYYVRGTVGGRRIEVSTKTANEAAARRFARDLEDQIVRDGDSDKVVTTFDQAASHYLTAKDPEARQYSYVEALAILWKGRDLNGIVHADFVTAANTLCRGQSNESKNRKVLGPGAAVLHYAAENRWCGYYRVKRLEERAPKTRAADTGQMNLAQRRATGALKILLTWLRLHGGRITDTLRVHGEHIDVRRGVYDFYVSKGDRPRQKPLAPLLWRYYRRFPPKPGPLFPFNNRWAVYRAIDLTGASVRPHAMRHALGRDLNAGGFGLRTIMEALDHSSPNSSLRYQSADVEIVRQALGGNRGKRRKVA